MDHDSSAATATAPRYAKYRVEHVTQDPAEHAVRAAPARPAPAAAPAASPEGIGDIVLAGRPAPYAHLRTRRAPTVGRLAAAARSAAAALARTALQSGRNGRWQPAPRAARRGTAGRMRVSTLVLAPNGFAAVSAGTGGREAVLQPAGGRVHLVTAEPNGEMRAVQELAEGRARVLGSADEHQLINTGSEPAVVVRVTG
ncbi:hypothetical protein GCM10027570_12320 [Streptomonospora sediminis]